MEIISKNLKQTFKIAYEFSKTLNKGDVVLLNGDLGAGKTAFVKGVAKFFDIKEEVTSPTYAYLNIYGNLIYHYDFYRINSYEEAELLGLNDYFNKDNICFIEWGENVKELLPAFAKRVDIVKISKNKRKIIL